jgi:putative ABC transport system substrate-binding protein
VQPIDGSLKADHRNQTSRGPFESRLVRAMRKKIFVSLLPTLVLTFVCLARAQQPAKVPRIGFLTTGTLGRYPSAEAFRQGLRELGYVEGKNLLIEFRHADGGSQPLSELAEELVRLKVDVIVTTATEPSLSAQRATRTIPIVMGGGGDPVGAGLVASLARPGGNITGVTTISVDLSGKRLELLKEVTPKISPIAVLWIPTATGNKLQMKETEAAAHSLGLHLQRAGVQVPDDFESAFSAIARGGASSLIVLSSPMFASYRTRIVDLAAKSRLPAIYPESNYADAGGLMSYGPNLTDLYRRAAVYVDKILKGAKPADLPVERPMKFELAINFKTAKQIGLTIPDSVLYRVDKVIK